MHTINQPKPTRPVALTGKPHVPERPRSARAVLSRAWESGLAFVLAVLLVRMVYLIWFCPYTLIEDEAHYWEWSRRPELSYYSKGPGVAWCIAAGTHLFGTHVWSIRLAAAFSGAIGAFSVAGLARDMTKARYAGLVAAIIYTAIPAYFVLGILITIDGPFLACWAAACWAGWRVLTRRSLAAWATLGLAIGAGFLIKYTMILFVPGFLLAAWLLYRQRTRSPELDTTPPHPHPHPRTHTRGHLILGLLLAAGLATLGLLPVILWNAQHDWITIGQLLGHLGLPGGDAVPSPSANPWHYEPKWTLELLGTQIGLGGPAILLAVFSSFVVWRSRAVAATTWQSVRYLVCASVPVFLFYVLVSFIAEPEGNWPIAAYVAAAPLGAIGVTSAWPILRKRKREWLASDKQGRRPKLARIMTWRWTVGFGIAMVLGFARADLLIGLPIIGPLVPKGRLMFADVRAADATRILEELQTQTGLEPFVIAHHYGRTSQLAYYLPGQSTVYCAGAYMNGPRKQYDLWDQTNLANPEVYRLLKGRPALLVGGEYERWLPAFERVEKIGQLKGEHKKGRMIYLGYAYRGFPATRPKNDLENSFGSNLRNNPDMTSTP